MRAGRRQAITHLEAVMAKANLTGRKWLKERSSGWVRQHFLSLRFAVTGFWRYFVSIIIVIVIIILVPFVVSIIYFFTPKARKHHRKPRATQHSLSRSLLFYCMASRRVSNILPGIANVILCSLYGHDKENHCGEQSHKPQSFETLQETRHFPRPRSPLLCNVALFSCLSLYVSFWGDCSMYCPHFCWGPFLFSSTFPRRSGLTPSSEPRLPVNTPPLINPKWGTLRLTSSKRRWKCSP